MRSPCAVFVLGLTGCGLFGGGKGDDGAQGDDAGPVELDGGVVTLDVPYVEGGDPLQRLDVYAPAPAASPAPVVIWVHGGAWALGDKAFGIADKVRFFVEQEGYVLVSVNYRLSPSDPDAPLDPDRIKYPIHEQDVAAATAWVVANAASFGGDPARIAVLGHSAGAHLATLVATDPSFLAAHDLGIDAIRCIGSFDTESYDIPTAYDTGGAMQRAILVNAFGDDPAVWAEASPIEHVGAGIGEVLMVRRGTSDRQAIQVAFRDTLDAAGLAVTLVDASALDHEGVNDAIGAPGDTIMTPPIQAFLRDCLP